MSIDIIREFTEFKSLECDLKYRETMYKKTLCKQYLSMIMFVIISLIMEVLCPVLVNRTNLLLKIYLYPLPMDSIDHIPILVLRYCIHFVEIVPYYFYISASNVMHDLILKELRLMSSYLKRYKTKDDSDFKKYNTDINILCSHFQKVCNLLRLTNKMTQMQTFFTILSGKICIFSLLYGWRNGLSHVLEYKYVIMLSLGKVCHSAYIFLRGFRIHFMISKIRDRIYNINVPEYSIEMVSKINLVLSRINTGTIGISIGGIAVISPMLFVEILGIMLTYAIVVLQTQKE
ncbi:uncharacterized protein LOC128248505 isoform X1 [Octopus bimaculoides]|uniref:uncharacterized protein LOC128248505 isoform X1 n=1 Tax=Octopus bimaculoides TaxID=37653 RepID=UPI0022E5E9B0|nr:uncharacterized protein LOC128248505 isoform X1 [Octopus bimaculoides]